MFPNSHEVELGLHLFHTHQNHSHPTICIDPLGFSWTMTRQGFKANQISFFFNSLIYGVSQSIKVKAVVKRRIPNDLTRNLIPAFLHVKCNIPKHHISFCLLVCSSFNDAISKSDCRVSQE